MILQIIDSIAILLIVLIFGYIVLFQKREKKLDLMTLFMNGTDQISWMRFASFVCLWLFVWMVKRSVGLPTENVNMELIVIVGVATFAPKLLQKFIEKYTK